MLTIYDETFRRFGLQMSYEKTETMVFNTEESLMEKENLVTVASNKLKNVTSFRYLGYTISNAGKTSHAVCTRIGSAFQKWEELKHVLTDRRIKLPTRIKFLTACVRSRLLYSVQVWDLSEEELRKIEVVWHGFLRKMVRGGHKRKNAPDRKTQKLEIPVTSEPTDWSYVLSNEQIRDITKTLPIRNFCIKQQLKYLAHVCRMDNNSLQKQILFSDSNGHLWRKIERDLGIEPSQARRMMMKKKDFLRLLGLVFQEERPKAAQQPRGKT